MTFFAKPTIWKVGVAASLACVFISSAQAASINASNTGWISESGANAGGFNDGVHNNFAGWENERLNNWFNFVLPSVAISSATLYIWSSANNPAPTLDPSAFYSLHQASSFDLAGLAAGATLGTVTLATANTGIGEYIGISLNGAGLAALNANLGGEFNFGGAITTTYPNPETTFDQIAAWGWTDGTPIAYLDYAPVPEPESYAMLLVGLGLVGFAVNRRKPKAATA